MILSSLTPGATLFILTFSNLKLHNLHIPPIFRNTNKQIVMPGFFGTVIAQWESYSKPGETSFLTGERP
jgi:hypothetical protein